MNVVCRILTCLTASAVCWSYGVEDENQMALRYEQAVPYLEMQETREAATFWEHFEHSLDERTQRTFTDRLHPLKTAHWNARRDGDSWEDVVDRGNRRIKSSLSRSIQYSLRDAALSLPFVAWLEDRQDALSELFVSSVDAVDEESVEPLQPSYRPEERRWWQSLNQSRTLRYGIRPFRTDPYAFLSMKLHDGDRLRLLGHMRYHFKNFGDHRFEMAVSLPLAQGLALDVGTDYQFGRNEDEKKLVFKVFKSLPQGGVFHLGVDVQRTPTLFAGISLPL